MGARSVFNAQRTVSKTIPKTLGHAFIHFIRKLIAPELSSRVKKKSFRNRSMQTGTEIFHFSATGVIHQTDAKKVDSGWRVTGNMRYKGKQI